MIEKITNKIYNMFINFIENELKQYKITDNSIYIDITVDYIYVSILAEEFKIYYKEYSKQEYIKTTIEDELKKIDTISLINKFITKI